MPGIVGCISLYGSRAVDEVFSVLAVPLEGTGQRIARIDNDSAKIAVLAPSLGFDCLGVAKTPSGMAAFYGEFYGNGFKGLTGTDTAQLLVDLHAVHGRDLPGKLDGSFVVFVQSPKGTLIFNDHYGSRPLFYQEQDGYLRFSPEPKSFILRGEIDWTAVGHFICIGHLISDQSYIKGVRALKPGTALEVRANAVESFRHYDYVPCVESATDKGLDYYSDALSEALLEAVRKRLTHIESAIVPISGGYDSRGILACLMRLNVGRLRTVSWGTDETTTDADAAIGRTLAEHFGTEHRFVRRESESFIRDIAEMVNAVDGMTDDPAMHHNELHTMRRIRDEMGGEYLFRGDEVFGFGGAAASDKEALGRIGIYEAGDFPDVLRLFRPDFQRQLPTESKELFSKMTKECPFSDYSARKDYFYFTQRLCNYLNRASYYKMRVLEVTNPWLDKCVLAVLASAPVAYRVKKALYRYTISKMFPDLGKFPIARRSSLEDWPALIRQRKDLQEFFCDHLLGSESAFFDVFDRSQFRRAVEVILAGGTTRSVNTQMLHGAKEAIRRLLPGLYKAIKGKALNHLPAGTVPADQLLFRLLVMKLWFDRYAALHAKSDAALRVGS